MANIDEDEKQEIAKEFDENVNMTSSELKKWLETEESQSVGWKEDGDGESTGHESGRKIVDIRDKNKGDLDEEDYAHMRKVNSYVKRHMAQGGPDDKAAVEDSKWRHSLMNWGHDPLKK